MKIEFTQPYKNIKFGKFADIPDGVIVRIWFRIIKGSSLDWCIYSEYKDCSGM